MRRQGIPGPFRHLHGCVEGYANAFPRPFRHLPGCAQGSANERPGRAQAIPTSTRARPGLCERATT
eukprot:10007547-Lingulodinium_polyedra.AAC.1